MKNFKWEIPIKTGTAGTVIPFFSSMASFAYRERQKLRSHPGFKSKIAKDERENIPSQAFLCHIITL